ncbi:putative Inter-alpha-trypsin inhibitor heavy chain H3 [Heracleum sosnowskyi]|uniref:Inter-alpha-trypsin inhibitor heavy chain H3 n=1 Tax=Heracleum sosnowskyi TaxID=360622 RepID=A0AAD8NDB1_9APIA|nr:putative Inter-alpha-trypsin inhibitor heavy chain H3 [Heracleum sosnowskyi]
MSFNDDEQIVADPDASSGNMGDEFTVGKAKLRVISSPIEAPLEEADMRVMLELTGQGNGKDRPGLDLVTVLDVSGSMKGERIEKLKTAMEFVIKKLSSIDRLSVITFSANAKRLCPLRQITSNSRLEILSLVSDIVADGATNITDGLQKALQVLNERRYKDGRSIGIMLMSDGEQNAGGDAAQVPVSTVPVYTFGFGTGGKDPKAMADVLNAIAKNGDGGTYSEVQNTTDLSVAFASCLGGLLTVAVQDLRLTVSAVQGNATIVSVIAGDYPQSKDNTNAITIRFGTLYDKEIRRVIVNLLLPEVPDETPAKVLRIDYLYRNTNGLDLPSAPVFASVQRVGDVEEEEEEEVKVEESRIGTAKMMIQAREMADTNKLNDAKNIIMDAQNKLDDVGVKKRNAILEMLKEELDQLMTYLQSPDTYKNQGRSFALASELSHARQRFAARGGDVDKFRMFSTPRMDLYKEQAKKFDKNPTTPVPTVEDDVKEEIAANPLLPIIGPLTFYLQQAILALQSIESILTAGVPK